MHAFPDCRTANSSAAFDRSDTARDTAVLLTEIWEGVLGRSDLEPDANFFDLGGDSLLATQLFAEIEAKFGAELPPDLIFETPTIENMARILDAELKPEAPSALITMKSGEEGPPLFVIPGAPGSALQLGQVVSKISEPIPVYAIKPKGSDGVEAPLETIEAMAEHCIEHILSVRRQGPYFLTGYSLGGVVAFEIARRLAAAGHDVPLLLLLDSYPNERSWSLRCHVNVLASGLLRAAGELRMRRASEMAHYLGERCRGLLQYVSRAAIARATQDSLEDVAPNLRRVYAATERAASRYRPGCYDGRILFFQASKIALLEPRQPAMVWKRFVGEIETCRLLGDHLTMLTDHAETTAAALSQYIERLRAAKPASRSLGTASAKKPSQSASGSAISLAAANLLSLMHV